MLDSVKIYTPLDGPLPWIETSAKPTPIWAKLSQIYSNLFPDKKYGRVVRALSNWGRTGPKLFKIRLNIGCDWLVDLAHWPDYAMYSSPLHVEGSETFMEIALTTLLQSGDKVLDIGANKGYYTLMCRNLVGSSGRVVAVEALPLTSSYLVANLRLNGFTDVVVCNLGVGESERTEYLNYNVAALGCSTLHGRPMLDEKVGTQRLEIPVRTTDSLLEEIGLDEVNLLKIDVEGHELSVLRGSEKLIRSCRPIVLFEAFPENAQLAGWSITEVGEFLQRCGDYQFAAIKYTSDGLIRLNTPLQWADFDKKASDIIAWTPRDQLRIDRFEQVPPRR